MDGSTPDPTHPPNCQQAAVGGSGALKAPHTQTPPRSAMVQVPAYHRVVPLVLRCLGAGELPSHLAVSCGPSDSATWFSSPGFLPSSGASTSQQWRQLMPMSCERITVLLVKDVMKPVPPADMKAGFFIPYIIVPKKSSGLRPILGLHILNWAFHKPPFKMLTQKCIFGCIRPRDRSAAVDLKDPYFHVSIFPRHRSVLRFAFEGRAYHYKVLPFGLSLSSCVFTKVAEAALVPLREHGVRILNYLDDWLILAPSQDQLCEHRDLGLRVQIPSPPQPVGPSGQLGKEQTLPNAEDLLSRYGVRLGQSDSTPHKRTCSFSVELLWNSFRGSWGIWRRQSHHWGCSIWDRFNTGSMAESWGGRGSAARSGFRVTPACRQTFTPYSDLSFLRAKVSLKQVSRQAVVYTDAFAKGWGATFNRLAVLGVWTGPQLHWHINCLEWLAVHLALNHLKRCLRGEQVLVRTDNTATVAYINRQGGLRSRRNLPATFSSGVRSIWGLFVPFTFQACSTGQPTSCHKLRSPESGDSISRWSTWFGDVSDSHRYTCLRPQRHLIVSCFTPWQREHSARTRWHTAGRGAFASMHFPY